MGGKLEDAFEKGYMGVWESICEYLGGCLGRCIASGCGCIIVILTIFFGCGLLSLVIKLLGG